MAEAKTIARPYAKAAFEAALAADALDSWAQALALLSTISQQPKVLSLIGSPSLTGTEKSGRIKSLCDNELTQAQQNFVAMLAVNKRLALLPEIEQLYGELKAERERTVNVQVSSAYPLDQAAEEKLAVVLKQKLRCEVNVASAIDESLLGGVVIKAGDVVIDGSVKGRLAKLAEAMNS